MQDPTPSGDRIARGLSNTFHLSNRDLETIYRACRSVQPVTYLEDIDFWAVTGYEDVRRILADSDGFSCEIAMDPITPFSREMRDFLADSNFGGRSNMVANATPSHARIRRHAQKGFVPRRLARLEPRIRQRVDRSIDGFIDDGRADLVEAMLYELPAAVLFLLLGIPESEVGNIKRWADNRLLLIFGKPDPDQQMAAARELVAYWNYCLQLVADKAQRPGDDLTSELLEACSPDAGGLSLDDVHNTVFGLLLAGHETTSNMSANAVLALLQNDGTWRSLAENPDAIAHAVEELLRYRPSVVAWRRKALRSLTLGGQSIPAGARLMLFLAAANRDEAQFDHPDALDLERENARSHISFGYGAHFCLGAPLARLELKIILEQLTSRLPSLRLDGDRQLEFIETVQFRGPKELPVRWD